jgi:DHA2 family multidrug resistance protein
VHQAYLSERINPLNPLATEALRKMGGVAGAVDPGSASAGALRMMYALVQRQAAMLSYMDLYRGFAIGILCVTPLVLLMKKAVAQPGDMTAH